MAERPVHRENEGKKLTQEEIQKVAFPLFNSALIKLSNTPELKDALTYEFLNQRNPGENHRIEFNRDGYKYKVILSRDVTSERLDIDKTQNYRQEGISLWLVYDEEFDGSCKLFEGRRGNLDHAAIQHRIFFWDGKGKNVQFVNTQEAIDKTSKFIELL